MSCLLLRINPIHSKFYTSASNLKQTRHLNIASTPDFKTWADKTPQAFLDELIHAMMTYYFT